MPGFGFFKFCISFNLLNLPKMIQVVHGRAEIPLKASDSEEWGVNLYSSFPPLRFLQVVSYKVAEN